MKVLLPLIALLVLLGGIAAWLWPMLLVLHYTWLDKYGPHSHGYLVLALSIWFAIRAWRIPPRPVFKSPVWSAAPVLVALLGIAALSEALYLGPIRTAVLPLLLLASVALCLGSSVATRMAWPVLFVYFAIPVWGAINTPLQTLTTAIAQSLVPALGVPVFVEGNFVHLPSGTFEIASGCSGMNYFVASLTLAAIYCTLFLGAWRSRLILMVAAACAGLVANWLRVSSLIIIGHVTKMQHYLIRVDHLYYGWALFLLTMVPVILLARRLEDREHRSQLAAYGHTLSPMLAQWLGRAAWALVSLMILATALLVVRERIGHEAATATPEIPAISAALQRDGFASGWQPVFRGAQERKLGWTRGETIEIYIASFVQQSREARLSHADNSVTGHSFQLTGSRVIEMPGTASGASLLEIHGLLAGRERILWTWYDVAGRTAWSKRTLRTAELLGMLSGRRDAKVTALLTDCQGDCAAASERLRAFLAQQ